jgi:hypothetical protein
MSHHGVRRNDQAGAGELARQSQADVEILGAESESLVKSLPL